MSQDSLCHKANEPPVLAVGVVLAAGRASRFGGGKLLALAGGRPLVTWAVRAALDSGLARVLVVVGHRRKELEGVLPRDPRVKTLFNPGHAQGMGTSLARAAEWAREQGARVLTVLLGDQPLISPSTVAAVTREALSAPSGASAARMGKRRGHPVAFAREHFSALSGLGGDSGGRKLLDALGPGVILVPAARNSALDVDWPQDLARVDRILAPRGQKNTPN